MLSYLLHLAKKGGTQEVENSTLQIESDAYSPIRSLGTVQVGMFV